MDTLAGYDDERLARDFGELTLHRAREYAATGRVSDLAVSEASSIVVLRARVRGSAGRTYSTAVTLVDDAHEDYVTSRCSCPVAVLCKHGAAVVLHARAVTDTTGPGRSWERRLARVLDELEDAAEAAAVPRRPLGLQLELTPGRSSARHAWDTSRTARSGARGFLRMRPLQRGARGTWVKGDASWAQVSAMSHHEGWSAEQVALLNEILTGFRAANRQSYYGADQHLGLTGFGPALWPQLRQAQDLGVPLLPAGLLTEVTVAEAPVTLQLDVGAGGDPEGAAVLGVAQVRVGVRHGEEFTRVTGWRCSGTPGTASRCGPRGDGHAGTSCWRRWPGRPAPQTRRLIAAGRHAAGAAGGPRTTWSRTTSRGCSGTCPSSPPTSRSGCRSRPSRGSR